MRQTCRLLASCTLYEPGPNAQALQTIPVLLAGLTHVLLYVCRLGGKESEQDIQRPLA